MTPQKRKQRAGRLLGFIEKARRWPPGPDLLIFAGALGLYIKTLCPTVYTFDSAEFAAGVYTMGIVHETGYPLYLMLAKLFTLLVPVGDFAYRVNMFSALCAALSLVVVRRLALTISGSSWAAWVSTAMLGVSYPFWSEALVAEVYTLHILFLSTILLLSMRWRATGSARFLVLLGLALGLSFGNHMSTILSVPGLAFLAWDSLKRHRQSVSTGSWLAAGAAWLAGPLTYLYLPLRFAANPALNIAAVTGLDLGTARGILSMVRGEMFSDWMFAYSLPQIPYETWSFLVLLWQTFLGFGSILAAVGLWDLWKRDRPLALGLGLIFAGNAVFYINYLAFDKDTMFLPAFLVLSLWMAQGLRALHDRLQGTGSERSVSGAAALLVAAMLVLNYPRVDLSNNWITRQYAEAVLKQVSPGALIVGAWIEITPLEYLQIVEGQRPDVTLFDYGLYIQSRTAALVSRGLPLSEARRIPRNEIRRVISDQLSKGRPAYSLDKNTIVLPAFELVPVSDWHYAIQPVTYEGLRPR
jgi:hypothetical protein